jgi:hypothetical protein
MSLLNAFVSLESRGFIYAFIIDINYSKAVKNRNKPSERSRLRGDRDAPCRARASLSLLSPRDKTRRAGKGDHSDLIIRLLAELR